MRTSHSLSRRGVAAAALASTALALAPGPAGATQLADALVGAYQTNPQLQAERATLLATEQNVLLNAVDAYATAWQDRSVLELALNNEQRLRRELEATRDRFRVGEVARTDVAQAEASLSQSRADVETAKSDLATAVAVYRQVVGSDPGVLQQPRSVPDPPRDIRPA